MVHQTIQIHFKLAGFLDGQMMTYQFDLEVPQGVSLKKAFKLADKSRHYKGKLIKRILKMPRPPTVLLNGNSLDVPGDLDTELGQGDEVAIMTPVGGG
ncbi:MAG: MoaD/ThiS family protein [bacterium]